MTMCLRDDVLKNYYHQGGSYIWSRTLPGGEKFLDHGLSSNKIYPCRTFGKIRGNLGTQILIKGEEIIKYQKVGEWLECKRGEVIS